MFMLFWFDDSFSVTLGLSTICLMYQEISCVACDVVEKYVTLLHMHIKVII